VRAVFWSITSLKGDASWMGSTILAPLKILLM
jgi:hypothetical protein